MTKLKRQPENYRSYIFNAAALLISAAVICLATLILAIGMYEIDLFFGYFRNPLIFLLNYLPVLSLELLIYFLCGRLWISYLITGTFFLLASLGDFFKLKFRYEPFLFSDFHMINAALGVAKDYDLTPNFRIMLAAASLIAVTIILFFAVKTRPGAKLRISGFIAVLAVSALLVKPVYFSREIYENYACPGTKTVLILESQKTAARGFIYPFIHSIGTETASEAPPAGYDEGAALEILARYADEDIPENRRVNVLMFQLESFCDLTSCGFENLDGSLYEPYHELEKEGLSGTMIANVFGGSTVITEHNVFTGEYDYRPPSADRPSYVRYFLQQGYQTVGSHPYPETFYNRANVNSRMGFQNFRFYGNYFSQFMADKSEAYFSDELVFSSALEQCLEIAEGGGNVFSYNVTFQGHGPYPTESNSYGTSYWQSPDGNTADENIVNFYLGGVNNTITQIVKMTDTLRKSEVPVVVVLFGDHKPLLDSGTNIYEIAGVNFNVSTTDGFLNYYSTPYLIWQNPAAEKITGSIAGEGPEISSCYIMNLLFECMGWKGNAFAQYMSDAMQMLPVITTHNFFSENGEYVYVLSEEGEKLFNELRSLQYYYRTSYPMRTAG